MAKLVKISKNVLRKEPTSFKRESTAMNTSPIITRWAISFAWRTDMPVIMISWVAKFFTKAGNRAAVSEMPKVHELSQAKMLRWKMTKIIRR